MRMRWFILLLLAFGGFAVLPALANAQSLVDSGDPPAQLLVQ